MEEQSILYETLGPLGASAAVDTTPPTTPSSITEPYSVFRNKISLSEIRCPSPEFQAPDYFSLDLEEEPQRENIVLENRVSGRKAPDNSILAGSRTLDQNWFKASSRIKSPMLRLHKEILDFSDFLSSTPEEQQSRNAAIETVFDVIKYIWPHCKVEVFGSFKTGLYLPSSDIDMVILGSNVNDKRMGLQALSRALSRRGIAKKMQVIAKARIPIVKFVEKKSDIAFDISFDVDNGPKAADFIKDAVSKWPPLRPLCLILKIFLQQRELNEVYTGGIGSYALLSMLIAMFQTQKDWQASPEYNLGVLLVNFFDMYGCKLNTTDVGVSCNEGGVFFKKRSKGFMEARPNLIAIVDPQDPDNDIGKNSFNYYQARSAFAMAFSLLTNTGVILRLGESQSILGAIIRPDPLLLERKGGSTWKRAFENSLPVGVVQLHSVDDGQEMYCNWPYEDEEPLPRENGTSVNDANSSGKKRKKASSNDHSNKRGVKTLKENRSPGSGRHENGSSSRKKQRSRHIRSSGIERQPAWSS